MIGDDIKTIDKYRLDDEWIKQPDLYWKFSKLLAKHRKELAEKENEAKLIRAQLFRRIRENPQDYFVVGKATNDAIENMIIEQPKYQKAQREIIMAQYKVDLLFGIEKKLTQRKEAIQDLIKLQGRDYFSQPSIEVNNSEEMERIRDKAITGKTQKRGKAE
jgi:hypothetical protein